MGHLRRPQPLVRGFSILGFFLLMKPHGNAVPTKDRFWTKVNIKSPEECWEWTAWKNKDYSGSGFILSYGRIRHNGSVKVASRVAWELTYGEIPEGMLVLHKCDNPPCVNPNHLFLGTSSDNTIDAINKGRRKIRNGNQVNTSKLNESQVIEIRKKHKQGGISLAQLGREYGVRITSIHAIIHRRAWKHVIDNPAP